MADEPSPTRLAALLLWLADEHRDETPMDRSIRMTAARDQLAAERGTRKGTDR